MNNLLGHLLLNVHVLFILEGTLLDCFERLVTISDGSDGAGAGMGDWSGVTDELKDSIANLACDILKCLQQT